MHILSPHQFVTWDEPIEMLYACHGKVKRFCRQLRILPDYLEKHGYTQAVLNDVEQILTYFNVAAPLHHQDEELDFFPALIQVSPQSKEDIALLETQHESLHQNWHELSKALTNLISEKETTVDPLLIERFIAGYEQHISLEEQLFELGKSLIPHDELNRIGKNMAKRRHPSSC